MDWMMYAWMGLTDALLILIYLKMNHIEKWLMNLTNVNQRM